MRTPHKGTFWGELSRYVGKEMGGAGEEVGIGGRFPTASQTISSRPLMNVSVNELDSAQDFLRESDPTSPVPRENG